MPHEKWGEAPHAFVVLQAGAQRDRGGAHARSRASASRTSRCPHGVHFVAELPKTATGKIQKFVLRGGQSAISRQ